MSRRGLTRPLIRTALLAAAGLMALVRLRRRRGRPQARAHRRAPRRARRRHRPARRRPRHPGGAGDLRPHRRPRRRDRVGQHHRRPQDPRGVPRRRDRHRLGRRHPAALRALDRHRRPHRRRPRDGRPRGRTRRTSSASRPASTSTASRTSRARRSPTARARPRARSCSTCCARPASPRTTSSSSRCRASTTPSPSRWPASRSTSRRWARRCVKTYLAKYERDGATTIAPGVRDDAWTLYAPTTVLEDADKAAAIKEYVAALGQGPAVDLRAPRRVRRGLLRRPRGPLARGRGVRRRGARRSSPCRPAGTTSSPATRRPSTPSSRSRTRSRWTSRRSTTAASRRPSPTARGGIMTTLTAPSRPVAAAGVEDVRPVRRRLGPGTLDPLRRTHRHRRAARRRGSSARPPACSTRAP